MCKNYYVYKFLGENDEVLYIGQTDNLKRRMREHFSEKGGHLEKEQYAQVKKAIYARVSTKESMNNIERHLISTIKPPFNKVYKNVDESLLEYKLEIREEMMKWTEYKKEYLNGKKPLNSALFPVKKPSFFCDLYPDFSLKELRLLSYILGKIDISQEEEQTVILNRLEFFKILGITPSQNFYGELASLLDILSFDETREIPLAISHNNPINSGYTELVVNPEFVKRLREIPDNECIIYNIEEVFTLTNRNTFCIYEILKFKQSDGDFSISIDDLKKLLNIDKKQYQKDFFKKVILTAMEEINNTDIIFKAEEELTDSVVTGVKFAFTDDFSDSESEYDNYLKELIDEQTIKSLTGMECVDFDLVEMFDIYKKACEKIEDARLDGNVDIFEYIKINYYYLLKREEVVDFENVLRYVERDKGMALRILALGDIQKIAC